MQDRERTENIRNSLRGAGLQALVCALPKNVLLLSGYWPVVGSSVAMALDDGSVMLAVPKDEEELAREGWADRIETFDPHPLDQMTTPAQNVRQTLHKLAGSLAHSSLTIGVEEGETSEPASYSAVHLYQASLAETLQDVFGAASLVSASELLRTMRSRKTKREISRIRAACEIAQAAFEAAVPELRSGMTELEAAQLFAGHLSTGLIHHPSMNRAGGFAWVMSGDNSAKAHGAYARSRTKRLTHHDLILVHCNSYLDGYWTDITRTYYLGKPTGRIAEMYAAVFAARRAALDRIAAGVRAADIDHAARSVLSAWGFGSQFKHSAGHGVGFGAISPTALPRLHPKSPDVLAPGMVFNLEPAIYIEGFGGIRHCDMVALGESVAEVLTPFHADIGALAIAAARGTHA
jgi:Xaa-Pro aminopeptidase